RVKPLLRPVVQALGLRRPGSRTGVGGIASQDFSPRYLVSAVDATLRRLGTDYIDIYQLHSPSAAVVEAGEFVDALERLRSDGKIRAYGLAADVPDDVSGFDRVKHIASLQVPFSAIHRRAATQVLSKAAEHGVGVISRSCFAAGLLVGSEPEESLRERTPDWAAIMGFRAAAADLDRPRDELALQFNLAVPSLAVTEIRL